MILFFCFFSLFSSPLVSFATTVAQDCHRFWFWDQIWEKIRNIWNLIGQETLGFNMKQGNINYEKTVKQIIWIGTPWRFRFNLPPILKRKKMMSRERRSETRWRNCPQEYPYSGLVWGSFFTPRVIPLCLSSHCFLDGTSCSDQPRLFYLMFSSVASCISRFLLDL